jgi:UDP-N-acetylmuramate--alanine ligase
MKIHLIGIGGIGVSALAKYYLSRKDKVFGSDLAESEITKDLVKIGARVFIGRHKAKNIAKNTDLVICSPAVTPDNPELKAAKEWGIKCQSYPEALGKLTKKYFTTAVCGTHGKGTTTAMISLILIRAGFDPTVIIGTKMKEFGDSNFRHGNSKYLVIEADEYKESFLNYWPKAIVITTIDKDHLDYFKNLNNIIKAFRQFIIHLPKGGVLIANKDDKNTDVLKSKFKTQKSKLQFKTQNYSLKQSESGTLKKILKIPGNHILSDALAALVLARSLKIPDKISFQALSEYKGAWRRFEIKKLEVGNQKLEVIADYAHHPTEIEATLKAVAEKYLYPPKFSKGKFRRARQIWCVFQPHQYQRTFYLFDDFVRVLATAPVDKLILAPIYSVAGRESQAIKKKVSSAKLVESIRKSLEIRNWSLEINNVIYIPSMQRIAEYLRKNLKSNDVLVVMGAGDIYKLPELLED